MSTGGQRRGTRVGARRRDAGARPHRGHFAGERGRPVLVTPASELPDLSGHVRALLAGLGEDPDREGLLKTPERVDRALKFLTQGYRQDIDALLNRALFTVDYDEMVVVKDIEVMSLCEHHLLPFFGKAHVAYLPKGRVLGLSKIPRLVDAFARRLQVQERMTVQIAEAIQEKIRPRGVGVVIEAVHLCMVMRGVEKQHSVAITSCMKGAFRDQLQTREEFLGLLRKRHDGIG